MIRPEPFRRSLAAAIFVAAAALTALADDRAAGAPSREDADRLVQKVEAILLHGLTPRPSSRRTTVTEREVNAYFAHQGKADLPTGVIDPVISIEPDGRLHGRAVVDLDVVRKSQPRSAFSPWNLITGRLPVVATGVLTTKAGTGRFALSSSSVGGVPVPKTLLQEIVAYYSRTPEDPDGFNLDDPFALPAGIREITTTKAQALVVQ